MKNPDPQNNRMEFVFLFDVENGNPNGDPDAGNTPRVDPEDRRGLVTDVCLKRKVRNYIAVKCNGEEGLDIYVKERTVLQERRKEVGAADVNASPESKDRPKREKNRELVCAAYYDVRTFGAVMATDKYNSGQVRGPVQMTFAKSIDEVAPAAVTISRAAIERIKDEDKKETDFGSKHIIPYGLYRCNGFISPHFARQTGFDSKDLGLFWEALENMFDLDRSAARGLMTARKLIVFAHENPLGNAPAHEMLERVQVMRKDENKPPRQFADYDWEVVDMPKGVEVEVKI